MTKFEIVLSLIMITDLLCKLVKLSTRKIEKEIVETWGDWSKEERQGRKQNDGEIEQMENQEEKV